MKTWLNFSRRRSLALLLAFAAAPALRAQTFTVLHHFAAGEGNNPLGSWVLSGKTFYGVAGAGGSSNSGSVFAIDTDGTGFRSLHSFSGGLGGESPFHCIVSDDTVYGLTRFVPGSPIVAPVSSTIFAVRTNGSNFSILYQVAHSTNSNISTNTFDTLGNLVMSGNHLFGVDSAGYVQTPTSTNYYSGAIFSVNTNGTGFTPVFYFDNPTNGSGIDPRNIVLSGNTIYGVTDEGGSSNNIVNGSRGVLYAVNADGSNFRKLRTFFDNDGNGGRPTALLLSGSKLYGTTIESGSLTNGTLFSINTNGTGFQTLHQFGSEGTPSSLVLISNTLYGTASGLSSELSPLNGGSIFALNPDGSTYRTLYAFTNSLNGSLPSMNLILFSNALYGGTFSGGNSDFGTIFKLTLSDADTNLVESPSLVVTTTNDVVNASDFQTSLREALAYAATLGGTPTVTFSSSTANGAVNFFDGLMHTNIQNGTEMVINTSVNITGPGTNRLTIWGGNLSRLFRIASPSANVTISGLALTRGSLTISGTATNIIVGGAIFSVGHLTLLNNYFYNNNGVGIYTSGGALGIFGGTVNSTNNVYTKNFTDFGADPGGAILVGSNAVFTSSHDTISGNAARFSNGGGIALLSGGNFISDHDLITTNEGGSIGGGVYVGQGCTFNSRNDNISDNVLNFGNIGGGGVGVFGGSYLSSNSVISGNSGAVFTGGGIDIFEGTSSGGVSNIVFIHSTYTSSHDTITGNSCGGSGFGFGGGIYAGGQVAIDHATITNNYCDSQGGGISFGSGSLSLSANTIAGNQSLSHGGGIYLNGGEVNLTRTNQVTVTSTNDTISGNTAGGLGGGIYIAGDNIPNQSPSLTQITFRNDTIAGNSSTNGIGGGLFVTNSVTDLGNTLVTGNGTNDVTGTLSANNFNLIGSVATNILLGSVVSGRFVPLLANNGGPTPTIALKTNSPAINAGNNALASGLAFDQRGSGFPRIVSGTVDIGAVESSFSVVTDTTKPTINITAPTDGLHVTNASYTASGTTLDEADDVPVVNVFYKLNGANFTPASTGNNFADWTAALTLTPGANTLSAYSIDNSGNLSLTNTVSWVYDLVTNNPDIIKPTIANPVPASGLRVTNAAFTLSGTAADNIAVTMVFYSFNHANFLPASTDNNWANWSVPVTLIVGTNTLATYAVDAAGNRSVTNTAKLVYALPVAPSDVADYTPLSLTLTVIYVKNGIPYATAVNNAGLLKKIGAYLNFAPGGTKLVIANRTGDLVVLNSANSLLADLTTGGATGNNVFTDGDGVSYRVVASALFNGPHAVEVTGGSSTLPNFNVQGALTLPAFSLTFQDDFPDTGVFTDDYSLTLTDGYGTFANSLKVTDAGNAYKQSLTAKVYGLVNDNNNGWFNGTASGTVSASGVSAVAAPSIWDVITPAAGN